MKHSAISSYFEGFFFLFAGISVSWGSDVIFSANFFWIVDYLEMQLGKEI